MKKIFLGLVLSAIVLFWSAAIFYTILCCMPNNPINLPLKGKLNLGYLTPQGWAFFTKNPREEMLYVYVRKNNTWKLATLPNTSFYFGAGRDMRTEGAELDHLLKKVYSKRWIDYTKHFDPDGVEELKSVNVINDYLTPTICGDILVRAEAPIPWAWSNNEKTVNMPFRLVRLNIVCNN